MTKIKENMCFSILFNGFGPSKTIKKRWLPRIVFRGSQCQTFIKVSFWVPFSIFRIFKKAPFGHHFRVAGRQKPMTPNSGERPCRDPASHETILITVPFGPSVFFNVIFFDEDWLTFRFNCFSLCYVLYAIFITFVDNTTVNAKPLSPSIFEKIAPHFPQNSFFSFWFFFTFSYFRWFSGTPCLPPEPDWSDLWSILLPMQLSFYRPGGERAARFSESLKIPQLQIKGSYPVFRIEEKNDMCHFKERYFGWKTYLFGIGDPKMVLKWSQMVFPYPHPHPHPRRG